MLSTAKIKETSTASVLLHLSTTYTRFSLAEIVVDHKKTQII